MGSGSGLEKSNSKGGSPRKASSFIFSPRNNYMGYVKEKLKC